MTRHCVFIIAMLVAGCGSAPTPEEKARSDAADVAVVEAVQNRRPPPEAITLAGITVADRVLHGLSGGGCSFVPEGAQDGLPVLVAFPQKAMVKLDGKASIFAADSASEKVASGVRGEYVGRTHALHLADSGQGGVLSLTITDRFERPVFHTSGAVDCGA